jgi:uncharacterized protein (TIGR03435 family)
MCYKNNMTHAPGGERVTIVCAAALLTVTAMSISAQSPTPQQTAPLRFEVASVKPNKSESVLVLLRPSAPGRYQVTNLDVRSLISTAFSMPAFQIVNAPDWTQNERFDITAQMPAGLKPAPGAQAEMLRTLLAERFRLVTHRETRELPVSALVIARADGKVAPGLEPASPDCAPGGSRRLGPGPDGRPQLPPPGVRACETSAGGGSFSSGYVTMETISRMLSARMGRIVVDRTGLAGAFQVELTFVPEPVAIAGNRPQDPTVVDPNLPSLATALQEQLGLKLESTRAPVEVLVIDSVDRPTPD